MITRGPIFQVYPIDLSVAGSQTINEACSMVQFVRAEYVSSGALALLAKVNVMMGDVTGDKIPAGINTTIKAKTATNCVVLSWAAQPGVQAIFMLSNSNELAVHSPPASQLVTQSMGATLTATKAVVGVIPMIVEPGGTLQTRTLRNNGGAMLWIGGDGAITSLTGFPLAPGEVLTLSGTVAPIWAMAGAVGTELRILIEA